MEDPRLLELKKVFSKLIDMVANTPCNNNDVFSCYRCPLFSNGCNRKAFAKALIDSVGAKNLGINEWLKTVEGYYDSIFWRIKND